jgi:hypothetical protein
MQSKQQSSAGRPHHAQGMEGGLPTAENSASSTQQQHSGATPMDHPASRGKSSTQLSMLRMFTLQLSSKVVGGLGHIPHLNHVDRATRASRAGDLTATHALGSKAVHEEQVKAQFAAHNRGWER